jgi:hypothetical protein
VRPVKPKKEEEVAFEDCQDFVLFLGSGNGLDGKSSGTLQNTSTVVVPRRRGIPAFDYDTSKEQYNSSAMRNSTMPPPLKRRPKSSNLLEGQGRH